MSEFTSCVARVHDEWFHGHHLWFVSGSFPTISSGETMWLLADAVDLRGLIGPNRGRWLAGSKGQPRSVTLPAGSLPSLQVVGGPRFAALAKHPVVLLTPKGVADLRKKMTENPRPSPLPAPAPAPAPGFPPSSSAHAEQATSSLLAAPGVSRAWLLSPQMPQQIQHHSNC